MTKGASCVSSDVKRPDAVASADGKNIAVVAAKSDAGNSDNSDGRKERQGIENEPGDEILSDTASRPDDTAEDGESSDEEEEESFLPKEQKKKGRKRRRSRPPPARPRGTTIRCNSDDPHGLVSRYVLPQARAFPRALREIREGEKRTCWLWFVLPTAPYVVGGIERGSETNRHYALRTNAEVKAYLELRPQTLEDGGVVVSLRRNYLDMAVAVEEQILRGNTMLELFGFADAPKVVSSFRLFRKIGEEMEDAEVCDACRRILDLIDRNRADGDQWTDTSRSTKRKQHSRISSW